MSSESLRAERSNPSSQRDALPYRRKLLRLPRRKGLVSLERVCSKKDGLLRAARNDSFPSLLIAQVLLENVDDVAPPEFVGLQLRGQPGIIAHHPQHLPVEAAAVAGEFK